MAEIKCPMCGKPNPAELDVCQYCEARLKPVTDELARSQPPIHPGEEPTEQNTDQLEPILPQWLRDVRQQARDSAETDESAEQVPAEEEASQPEPEKPADLLAGLQSQADEDDEIPDWLAGLRGEESQTAPDEPATEDDDLAALKSMFGEDVPEASQESEDSALPGWISDLGAEETDKTEVDALFALQSAQTPGEPAQAEPQQPPASGSDLEWDADFESESSAQAESTEDDTPFDTDLPAWLQGEEATPEDESGDIPLAGLGAEEPGSVPESEDVAPPASEGDLPDWLSSLGEGEAQPASQQDTEQPEAQSTTDWLSSLGEETAQQDVSETASEAEIPDWAASLGEESSEDAQQTAEEPAAIDKIPDWAASTQGGPAETVPEQESPQPDEEIEIPDWISSLGESESKVDSSETSDELAGVSDLPDWATSTDDESVGSAPQDELQPTSEGDLPDWLFSLGEEEASQEGEELTPSAEAMQTPQPTTEDEMPDWLSTLGDAEDAQEEDQLTPSPESVETFQPTTAEETPDWLSSLGEETVEGEQPSESIEPAASIPDLPGEESDLTSTLMDDEGQPMSAEDVDSILSMDLPDWMSGSEEMAEGDDELAVEGAPGDDLDPVELPSWVQAMRPVESVISESDGETVEDQPVEEQGPLAGLRGVLPAVPGVGPSSKPKAYSVKLQASAEQQANATMLEQMLAQEEYPKPVSEQKVVGTQRLLRWVITVLLLLVVGGAIFGGTQINRMPTSAPLETSAVLNYVQNTLPTDAPVLMIFDYDAALAGELEPSAAPLVDHMLTLKHPRLSFVSSLPTGPGLAERFMTNIQGSHNYERDQQFVNLGYLPGGAAGVLAFSENPIGTKPLTSTGKNAWETPALQGVSNLSDFAAIILLTNDIETARTWIEQTEMTRGEARLLVVSSAQSGPMIQPYYQSGQIDGMVTGLDGSAPIEQVNSGRPGMVRRYWDAYGFGLLTAVALITLGSLWSLFSGWQARRKEQGEE
jgi:hypothetical protein